MCTFEQNPLLGLPAGFLGFRPLWYTINLLKVFSSHSKTSILFISLLRDRLAFLARIQELAFLASIARHARLPSLTSHDRHSHNCFWASDTHRLILVEIKQLLSVFLTNFPLVHTDHSLDNWSSLLNTGISLLNSGNSLLNCGSSLLDSGINLLNSWSSLLDSGNSLLYSGSSLLNSGSSLLDSGSSLLCLGSGSSILDFLSGGDDQTCMGLSVLTSRACLIIW